MAERRQSATNPANTLESVRPMRNNHPSGSYEKTSGRSRPQDRISTTHGRFSFFSIYVCNYRFDNCNIILQDIDTTVAVSLLSCHSGALRCMSLSGSGMMLATASERGTLLRVWCTRRRQLLHTLRRGSDHAILFWYV